MISCRMMVVVAILVADMIKLLRSMIAPGDPESGPVFRCPSVPCVPPIQSFAAATHLADGMFEQRPVRR